MFETYEIGHVIVVDGESPKIRFGETEMIFFRNHAYRLPQLVIGKAYETNLDSVLKFENYEKGLFGKIKKYFRDEIGVNVDVSDNVVFRKNEKKDVVIEWTGKKCLCEAENKSTLSLDDYNKLKELAMSLCAK